ncbi:MAG: AAA family ATPase, partial [Bdellovibrionales bacterium]|nr:AAA family ATPase [Bdellovibrionales bacterium]
MSYYNTNSFEKALDEFISVISHGSVMQDGLLNNGIIVDEGGNTIAGDFNAIFTDKNSKEAQDFKQEISSLIKEYSNLYNDLISDGKTKKSENKVSTENEKRSIEIKTSSGKTIKLNNQQVDALDSLEKWFNSNSENNSFTVSGYAGTGKTTIIKYFIDKIKNKYNVIASAPTNKAVDVIKKSVGIESKTLHSLLGLAPGVDLENFDPNNPRFIPIKDPKIDMYDVVVIDEASMINKELYDYLKNDYPNIKIIYMGDPAQLPPVNETESKVFSDSKNAFQLTKVERQKSDNPIFSVFDSIRSNINSAIDLFDHKTVLSPDGDGIEFLSPKKFFSELSKNISNFKENPSLNKILSWTNESVSKYNNYIRNLLFPNTNEIVTNGDFLIGYKSLSKEEGDEQLKTLVNSKEYIVENVRKDVYPGGLNGFTVDLKTTASIGGKETDVRLYNQFVLDHTDEKSVDLFTSKIKSLLTNAKKFKGPAWVEYFNYKNSILLMSDIKENGKLIVSKDIDYGYAMTVHKSQGSTYDNVFVDEDNINLNRKNKERNQLKYVAFTRASKNVYVRYSGEILENKNQSVIENKVITEDTKNQAIERIKQRNKGRLSANIDPNDLKDVLIVAGYYAEKGIRKSADIINNLAKDVGEWVREHSKEIIDALKSSGKYQIEDVAGINIISSSSDPLGAVLTNPTEISKRKGKIRKSYPVKYRNNVYKDAEEAYKKNKVNDNVLARQGKIDPQNIKIMTEIISNKLTQYPSIVSEIDKRGGVEFLENSSHIGFGNRFEGKGRKSAFISSLIDAYNFVKYQETKTGKTQGKQPNRLTKQRYYTGNIVPEKNTVFVFGSNPEGRHGAGAAKVAVQKFGAKYGQGEGLQGNA